MTALVKYEAARYALQSASKVDEKKPNTAGVYAFFLGTQCMYVGESKNIRKRLMTHDRKRQLADCDVRFFVCDNRKSVERWLIDELQPRKNGCSVFTEYMQARKAAEVSGSDVSDRAETVWMELFGETPFWARPQEGA